MIHELKTDPEPFEAIRCGNKTFELRKDDRSYAVGDILVLKKTLHSAAEMVVGAPLQFTGDTLEVKVRHLLRSPAYGLGEGWVILSIELKSPKTVETGALPSNVLCRIQMPISITALSLACDAFSKMARSRGKECYFRSLNGMMDFYEE